MSESNAMPPVEERSISINLPSAWHEVPTDPSLLESWWGQVDGLDGVDEATVHDAKVRLRSLLVEARGQGLLFAAAMLMPVESVADDGAPDLVTASVFIAGTHDPGMDGTVSTFALQTLIRQDELEGDRDVIADPDVVYLGGREALRVIEIEKHRDEETDSWIPVLGVTYFMATADRNGALQIGFRTPAIWLLEDFVGLFHDIAETFQVSA